MPGEETLSDMIASALEQGDEELLTRCSLLVQEALLEGFVLGKDEQVERNVLQIMLLSLPGTAFCERLFEFLLKLMQRPEFLKSDVAYSVLLEYEHEWELLTDSQKERLLAVLEGSYPAYKEFMPRFVITALLGEYYCDERAFQVLCRLRTASGDEQRALLPHGFEHIVRDCSNGALAERAYAELLRMRNDPSQEVRAEVEESLARLRIRGKTPGSS